MKKSTLIYILITFICFSCRKDKETADCGCTAPKTEIIENVFGIVVETDGGFEILTENKGLLIPCTELAGNFKIDSRFVMVSGTLKISCRKISENFIATPIEISEIKLLDSAHRNSDISLSIIKSEDYGYNPGFGYFIEDHRTLNGMNILQPHVPVISGLVPFTTPEQARKAALLVIYLMRKNAGQLPSLDLEILRYMNIII